MKPLIDSRPVFLTWLPLSHSYEHCVQFAQIAVGAKVFYAEKIEKLLENISEAKPTIMTAVPRFYQNLYNKININMKKQTGFKAKLIEATIRLGKKKLLHEKMTFSEKFLNLITNVLVRKKIKKQFGGNLRAFVSGGGALDKEIGEFLNSIGLPTLQGYGLTETSPTVKLTPFSAIYPFGVIFLASSELMSTISSVCPSLFLITALHLQFTWPERICPPSSSPNLRDLSKLTSEPSEISDKFVTLRVSFITSKERLEFVKLVTVKQTPFTATLAPDSILEVNLEEVFRSILIPCSARCNSFTTPFSCTIPVNIL